MQHAESISTTHNSERAYFGELANVPRFARNDEHDLARAVVAARHAYWTSLIAPGHVAAVLGAILEHAIDERVLALASALVARRDNDEETTVAELITACVVAGDEHAAADAIVDYAASIDATLHRDLLRARTVFLNARGRFIHANLRLVIAFANRYGAQSMPLSDRIQEGNIGLMKAVDRFDAERGVRFSTYAAWWIRHAITRALSSASRTVRIPPQIRVLFARAERARRRLAGDLGRDPSTEELAAAIGCEPKRLDWAMRAMDAKNISLDAEYDGGSDLYEALGDDQSLAALETAIDSRDRERAVAALDKLPAREQDILRERFDFPGGSHSTLGEIGRRHGISRERTRQLQQAALTQLRDALEPGRAKRKLLAPWK